MDYTKVGSPCPINYWASSTSSTDLSIIKKNLESDSIQVFEFMAFKYGRFAKFDKNVDFGKIAILSKKLNFKSFLHKMAIFQKSMSLSKFAI